MTINAATTYAATSPEALRTRIADERVATTEAESVVAA